MKKTVIILLLFSLPYCLLAQRNELQTGAIPQMTISSSAGDHLKFTFKTESVQRFYEYPGDNDNHWKYSHGRTDLQLFLDLKFNPYRSIAGGYHYRINGDGENFHRIIQQFTYVHYLPAARLAQRIRTDETFLREGIDLRLRYRLSGEFPLQGLSIDAREYYFIASLEPLYTLDNMNNPLETRLMSSIGYDFGSGTKLETGVDYRADKFPDSGFRQRIWWRIAFFLAI